MLLAGLDLHDRRAGLPGLQRKTLEILVKLHISYEKAQPISSSPSLSDFLMMRYS